MRRRDSVGSARVPWNEDGGDTGDVEGGIGGVASVVVVGSPSNGVGIGIGSVDSPSSGVGIVSDVGGVGGAGVSGVRMAALSLSTGVGSGTTDVVGNGSGAGRSGGVGKTGTTL